jgi:purine-binding chemotaxis protein CheW
MNIMEKSLEQAKAGLAGKYLTFILDRECYAIPVLKVREIIRMTSITAVPQMPDYIKGVINLRGKIIPVLDLCTKFGLKRTSDDTSACIVVTQVTNAARLPISLGLVVDGVEEVCSFSGTDIEDPPDFGAAIDTACILGMAKSKNGVKTLLDIDRVVGVVSDRLHAPGSESF